MAYLMVSFIAATAMSLTVYSETSSLLLAFVTYAATGTLVLMAALMAAAFNLRAEETDLTQALPAE